MNSPTDHHEANMARDNWCQDAEIESLSNEIDLLRTIVGAMHTHSMRRNIGGYDTMYLLAAGSPERAAWKRAKPRDWGRYS